MDISEEALQSVVTDMIDVLSLGVCFEVHKSAKCGYLYLLDDEEEGQEEYKLVDVPGLDVFGQPPVLKQFECECPHCKRHLAASRFAPHLEKCMGMGRTSSRIASRRIANASSGKNQSDQESDNDYDKDWTMERSRVSRRRRADKGNSPRRARNHRVMPGHVTSGSDASQAWNGTVLNNMSEEERRSFLIHSCGVISEHTGRMCTRSLRCPQHNEEQRQAVRTALEPVSPQHSDPQEATLDEGLEGETALVDIEMDELDSQLLHDVVTWEDASNPSPADSTSTNNSSSSRRRSQKQRKKAASKTFFTSPLEPLQDFQF